MGNCIIKSNSYSNSYLCGTASYCGDLYKAKIFNYDELPEYLLNGDDEIILLDSKKGLELLVNEIKHLNRKIPQEESKLNDMKDGQKALFNANPGMVSKFIERRNKRCNNLIGISSEEERKIIDEILEESKKVTV